MSRKKQADIRQFFQVIKKSEQVKGETETEKSKKKKKKPDTEMVKIKPFKVFWLI